MIAYTQDCIIGSEFACKVLCVFPLMQCSDTINLLWAMFGKDVCRLIALFYYVVAFSSLLLNIGILIVHCRNLARALFPFLSFFFLIVPVLFLVFFSFSVTYASIRTRLRADRLLLSLLVCVYQN